MAAAMTITASPEMPGEFAKAETYVRAVYRDLLGREPEPAGLHGWATALVDGAPVNPGASGVAGPAPHRIPDCPSA